MSGSNAVEVFGKLDTNKDGALTLEEFRGVTGLTRGTPAPPSPKPEPSPTTPQPAPTPKKPEPASAHPAQAPPTVEKAASSEGLAFFENKIRTVLAEKCYQCHSADEAMSRAPVGPSARELLMQDRNRLEKA